MVIHATFHRVIPRLGKALLNFPHVLFWGMTFQNLSAHYTGSNLSQVTVRLPLLTVTVYTRGGKSTASILPKNNQHSNMDADPQSLLVNIRPLRHPCTVQKNKFNLLFNFLCRDKLITSCNKLLMKQGRLDVFMLWFNMWLMNITKIQLKNQWN